MRLTVGPLPPAVYWRRRVIVLGATLLVLFVIVQACMASAPADDRAGSGQPSSSPSTASASGSPTADPLPNTEPDDEEADPGEPVDPPDGGAGADPDPDDCTDAEIEVTALASQVEFAVGEQVQFTIQIAHAADRSCRRDVGGDQRELYLVRGSGAEQVWSSQHCANPSGSEEIELAEDWARQHHIGFSGQETSECDGAEAAGPDLAPGDYQLWARLGTARSDPVTITLT